MFVRPAIPALVLLVLIAGCKSQEQEGHRVTSYDGPTHEWTIIRAGTFDGKYLRKRLIVRCTFFKWGPRVGPGNGCVPSPKSGD